MTRAEQLADAFVAIAWANHYMVGIVETVTLDELEEAEQILISRDNAGGGLFLALELVEAAIKAATVQS